MSANEVAGDRPQLIGKKGLANLMGVSCTSIDRLRASGKLGVLPLKIGSALRWDRGEVELWLSYPDGDSLFDAKGWATVKKSLKGQKK